MSLGKSSKTVLALALVGVLIAPLSLAQQAPPASASGGILHRQYREGETIAYRMKTVNRDRERTIQYEVHADGVVKKNTDGFFEEFAWSDLVLNGAPFKLSAANAGFRQVVSLEPNRNVTIPDLSKVDPILIGPITDLLTFYADLLLASRQPLTKPGDHVRVAHGTPNSWADGNYVTLGQDSIDFDITLTQIDRTAQIATVTVRHVPPEKPEIRIPAEWMKTPVADTPNNWVEVSRRPQGKFAAHVGKETFTATIRTSLVDGRIVSAVLENPVEVLERQCADAALTDCGEPLRYQILRQVEIK